MKLENASKPSQLESRVRGSGKMAINKKMIGSSNHTMEFLIEMEFFFNEITIRINSRIAATDISI